VLIEPIWADFYTPKAGRVFDGLERESRRIGYAKMLVKGQVRMVRKRQGGGYFVILTPMAGSTPTKRLAYRAEFVHLAVGYPGLRYLPELQEFRTAHQDFHHVVSAYEEHEHVYETARTKHLVVMLRGGGIVASRVLQRLMDDRAKYGLSSEIVHLFRTYVASSHGPNAWNRRKGAHGFAYQGFNYPKSVWGGQLKSEMRKREGDERAAKYKLMGGTNTPYRRRWQEQMKAGRVGGWYTTMAGSVGEMRLEHGKIVSCVNTSNGMAEVAADFVIDCTGLEADIAEHRVLADLLAHSGAGRNPLGRLDVERNFELRGSGSGPGVMYASGATTLGGYFPGVDTFLGLQVAAQEIADDLASRGFCRRIGIFRSIILATVAVLGIGWECIYHLVMQWRWEKDRPTLFGLATAIPEGVLVWLLLRAGLIPGISGTVPTAAFAIDFALVWLAVWLVANGPMRVPFIRWRFHGGRLV
jgi:hypothetical protein